ncbi:hypothetical protein QVD17_10125 [Tagetes erecta]|uniref:Uncharacterized protein n=1 Tax=Tagetes erecta TaxID=13708 RepID=A0AAD8P612_TARER|nr:hypothetical protein QVD17_10125 [Tagetes erecta]
MSTMMMPSLPVLVRPLPDVQRVRPGLKLIRAHSLGDEGRWSNLVDSSSMKILKDRMEVIRAKERLERSSTPYGWDYDSNYTSKREKQYLGEQYMKTIGLCCGTSSLSILIGTTLLYIFSVIVHLNL